VAINPFRRAGPAPAVAGRIPPGQSLARDFPVLHYGPVPRVDLKTWNLRLYGLVEAPLEVNWEQFRQLPRKQVTLDIHCVTRWSKLDTGWEGADLPALLSRIRPDPSAHFVVAECEYGFTTSVPLEVLAAPQALLADTYEGKPLTAEHGYPLRLIIPGKYFWKSAKWLRALKFVERDELGFWERHGYHNDADPWKEERFSND
jgi:DMSO/TMAO reductase YedYZ molybdopterin-dependent catalytic subunit